MKKTISILLCAALLVSLLAACGSSSSVYTESGSDLSYDDAVEEIASLLKEVDVTTVENPSLRNCRKINCIT